MKKIIFVSCVLFLTGCAQKGPMYNWGSYEAQTYSYFKGEPPEAQVVLLEKQLIEAKDKGQVLPPGFHAHLALLYEKTGRLNEMRQMFETEKRLYPESSTYINNILNGFKGLK
jgi:hypothetical protein